MEAILVAHCEYGEPLRGAGNGSGLARCIFNNPTAIPMQTGKFTNLNTPDQTFSWATVITVNGVGTQDPTQTTSDDEQSGCPSDHYCHPYESPSTKPSTAGFCCPKQKKTCPVGEPHPTANCSSPVLTVSILGVPGAGAGAGSSGDCPTKTHYCYQRVGAAGSVCCPRPCAQGLTLTEDGQCLPVVEMGAKCVTSEQCAGNSACLNGKSLGAVHGTVAQWHSATV